MFTENILEFGAFENHTKGIGSKLMTKMGWTFGVGIGKYETGNTEPIDIKGIKKNIHDSKRNSVSCNRRISRIW